MKLLYVVLVEVDVAVIVAVVVIRLGHRIRLGVPCLCIVGS